MAQKLDYVQQPGALACSESAGCVAHVPSLPPDHEVCEEVAWLLRIVGLEHEPRVEAARSSLAAILL